MKKYLLIISIVLAFVIFSSCDDTPTNPPADCNCVKIVYDTTTFDLRGNINTINKNDEFNYRTGSYDENDNIKVTLFKDNVILNEKFTQSSFYHYSFEKLDKNATYKLKFEKEGYKSKETISTQRNYTKTKTFDYEIVRHYDYCTFNDTILQPYIAPELESITGNFELDSSIYKNGKPIISFYSFSSSIKFRYPRKNLKALVSVSMYPNFEKSNCTIYNEVMSPYNDISIHIEQSDFNTSQFRSGEKVYIRAFPIKNGNYFYKDSKELGEPLYFELEAK